MFRRYRSPMEFLRRAYSLTSTFPTRILACRYLRQN
jgi:hypothetical protein